MPAGSVKRTEVSFRQAWLNGFADSDSLAIFFQEDRNERYRFRAMAG